MLMASTSTTARLKRNPRLKWLDLEVFARTLAPADDLGKVRYFTATISGKLDPSAPLRQQTYLRALRSLPLVEPQFGHFETREKGRPLVHPVPGSPHIVRIFSTEEKGSGVNLATWLLLDGADGLYEEAIVVSNDSDLEEPIRQANKRWANGYARSRGRCSSIECRGRSDCSTVTGNVTRSCRPR